MDDVYYPTLLDRLTNFQRTRLGSDSPSTVSDKAAGISATQLLRLVMLDLDWLFNTTRIEPFRPEERPEDQKLWAEARHAARSVVNFGLPPLSGGVIASLGRKKLEKLIHDAIVAFEPRIDPSTLNVRVVEPQGRENRRAYLEMEIQGLLWGRPVRDVRLRTELRIGSGLLNKLREA